MHSFFSHSVETATSPRIFSSTMRFFSSAGGFRRVTWRVRRISGSTAGRSLCPFAEGPLIGCEQILDGIIPS
jgi:hypothetical protein